MLSTLLNPVVQTLKDFLPITGIDYIEFYVGNARQSSYYYRAALGMTLVAHAGPETGLKDRASYVLQQGEIRLVLTTPLRPDSGMANHIHRHADGVRDVAFTVNDAKLTWRECLRRGARSVHECREMADDSGRVKVASIAAFGDTIHSFVERDEYRGAFLSGYEPTGHDPVARPAGLLQVDHVAGNVGWNESQRWTDFYSDVLGFSCDSELIGRPAPPEHSGAHSRVMRSPNSKAVFSINEPAESGGSSGIKQYLESYHGPGVQHIALSTSNILETVSTLRRQGVEFQEVPLRYYGKLSTRIGGIDEPVEALQQLGILIDRDESGYLLQAFTRPVEDRPTFFFEIIERKGSRGFGEGNAKAMAEAFEAEKPSLRHP